MTSRVLPQQQMQMKKRIQLVDRDFQLRYAKAVIIVGLLSTVLTGFLILYPLYVFEILRIPSFLPWPILVSMTCAAIVNILFLGYLGVYVTQRISGPVYRLVRQLRRLAAGRWSARSHLSLRPDDELRFLIRNYNEVVDSLVHMTHSDLKLLYQIQYTLKEQFKSTVKSDVVQQLEANVERLINRFNERLENSVDGIPKVGT